MLLGSLEVEEDKACATAVHHSSPMQLVLSPMLVEWRVEPLYVFHAQDEEIHRICLKPSWTIGQVKQLDRRTLGWFLKKDSQDFRPPRCKKTEASLCCRCSLDVKKQSAVCKELAAEHVWMIPHTPPQATKSMQHMGILTFTLSSSNMYIHRVHTRYINS